MIITELKSIIKKDYYFFAIFTIGVITCNIMFTYGYGIIMQLNERDGIDDFLVYNANSPLKITEIEKELDDISAEVYYYSPIVKDLCSEMIANDTQIDYRFIRTSRSIFDTNVVTGRIDGLKRTNSVIVPSNIKGIGIGDIVILNGFEFLVVGSSISDDFIMSVETFENNGFMPIAFSIDVPYRKVAELRKSLYINFENKYKYHITENDTMGLDDESKTSLLLIALIYALCTLSFMYLMISIYNDVAYELYVYEVIGAKRIEIIYIIGGVMLILVSSICFISQVIHTAFYNVFFNKLNIVSNYSYTINDYFVIFITTLLSVYIIVLMYVIIRTRRSTITNLRNSTK